MERVGRRRECPQTADPNDDERLLLDPQINDRTEVDQQGQCADPDGDPTEGARHQPSLADSTAWGTSKRAAGEPPVIRPIPPATPALIARLHLRDRYTPRGPPRSRR